MKVLNIDTIGPLSNDSSEKYILVIIDCFTRFVELAVRDISNVQVLAIVN
jgi:hypothetical protein